MTPVTLRQLRYFEALARHGHFRLAAEACAISQPALSMQIKELEDSLGTTLIERGARQTQLTPCGEQIAARARDILRAVRDLEDIARASREQMTGRLRLGVIPTIGPYLLPTLIESIHHHHPALDLHVRETLTQTLLHELKEGRLDVALAALPVSEPSLTEVALFSEPFVLVRPPGDAGTPPPSLEAVRQMRLLLLEEGHCFRDQALAFCNIPTGLRQEILDASSLSTLVQMASAGLGVTVIPEMAVAVETRAAPVFITRFAGLQPERTIGLIWRKNSPLAGQLPEIAEAIRTAARALRQDHQDDGGAPPSTPPGTSPGA